MNEPEFGTRIKTLRQQKGLSQEALAAQLEVSHQAVAKWEGGRSKPSTANLLALCGVFGVSLDQLVSGEDAAPEAAPLAPEPVPGPRRGQRMQAVLLVLTLASLACSIAATSAARNIHLPEQIIGRADGPTSILVSGPYLFGLPAEVFPLWAVTAGLAIATAVVFFRSRRKK